VIVLFTAIYCHLSSLALLHYTHGSLNAVLVVMPTLIYVLTISGAIHLVNYHRDARRDSDSRSRTALLALRSGWMPCTLAAISTAFGLSSLGVSHINPVRAFGLYSALAMLVSLLALLILVPSLLALWPSKFDIEIRARESTESRTHKLSHATIGMVIRHAKILTFLAVALVVLFALGLSRLRATVKFEEMFATGSEIVRNYQWLEESIGPTVPVEIVLEYPERDADRIVERLELLNTIETALKQNLEVGGVVSSATFVGRVPRADDLQSGIERRVFGRRLIKRTADFVDAGYLAYQGEKELWRITARVPALHESDYGKFVESVRAQVETVLETDESARSQHIELTCTGLSPVIHAAQLQLFEDLSRSFIAAFLLIYPMMAILLTSLRTGLIAMIPNILPAVIVFGGMGWIGETVDIGSMLCASVALGIAVDDTVHFLTWYCRGIKEGRESSAAVKDAFRKCSAAMFQTTLVCSFGMIVFLLSDFVPAKRFASLMFILLWLSLAADLLILPALLLGPLSRFVVARKSP
jgi:hypothetical protein